MEEQKKNERIPLYAARVQDLIHAPTIIVRCSCGHEATVSVAFIRRRVRDYLPLKDLTYNLRCRECDQRGNAHIDARAALGYER